MIRFVPLALGAAILGAMPACVPVVAEDDTCGASAYSHLVGRDRSVAEDLRLVQPKRVYGPDEAVTMDFNPDRINFVIGEDGDIAEVRCG
ncbi:I78 family peptidase inhibitor [Roseicyclus sp.]|uniref:I78 family peptidase inhibitor n=1 Tax=Roseicyclus sp. TaxID=1914329 RepID=UPI003F9F59D4